MTIMNFQYQQITKASGLWKSTPMKGDIRAATQGVIAGHLLGEPRAAVEIETGRVIYALNEYGDSTAAACKLFSTVPLYGG